MSNSDPILIVGGGLGGLTTALALARRGPRGARARRRAGIRRHRLRHPVRPQRLSRLDRLGLRDEVLAKADPPAALLMLDALDGKELMRIPTGASFRARFKHPYIIVHRIDLHNVLLDACRQHARSSSSPTPW